MTNAIPTSSMNGSTQSSPELQGSFVKVPTPKNSPRGMGSSESSLKQAEGAPIPRSAPVEEPPQTEKEAESKITYLPNPEEFFKKVGSPLPKPEVVFKFDDPPAPERPVTPKPFFTEASSFFEGFKTKIALGAVAAAAVAVLGYLFARGRK